MSKQCLYICPPPVLAKKNLPFDGSMTNPTITNALRYSQIVRGKGTGTGQTHYINSPVNAFGYYAGAPGGSGAPPRNTF